jgi:arylsulfatase A-like enzyme
MFLILFSGAEFHQKSERGPFGEALEEMDDSIGKMLDFIDQSGKREDTMVIFSSDNG